MANRIETAAVTGETIKLSSNDAGAAGSFNAVSLAFTFDSAWDGTTKIVQFLDTYGENPVNVTLTTNLLVDGAYIVPIPAEPLVYAGEINVTVRGVGFEADGTTAERIIMSASTIMKVKNSLYQVGGDTPVEPTPTQAEQLQTQIDSILADIEAAAQAAGSATAAAASALAAQTAETNAETAQTNAELAETHAETAEINAETAETNAVAAKNAAELALTHAPYIDGTNGNWFIWNATTSAYVDSGTYATGAVYQAEAPTGVVLWIDSDDDAMSSVTKSDIGLANVDNTSDTAKPVSTAQQTALNAKVNTSAIVNDLTTGGTTVPLSAEQGKTLSASISELTADLSNSSLIGSEIYGAYWGKEATPTLTRLNLAKSAIVNLGVDATYAVNEFDTSSLFSSFEKVTDDYGNVFIRIPRIYIKKVDVAGHKAWYASRRPFTGAYLPKCFWDFTNNKELDYVDVGAYTASSADGTRLDSKSGTYPLINKNIVQMRTMAQANGAGYQQLDIHVVDLLQTLFVIEQATIQSQSKVAGYTNGQYSATHTATVTETAVNRIIVTTATAALYEVGQAISVGTSLGGNQIFYGRTIMGKTVIDASNTSLDFDGAAVNIAVGNIVYNTVIRSGFSANIASSVGSIGSNSAGKQSFVWHGIESLFGSVYRFVDGVNINERQVWVCPNATSYASNLFTSPYEQLSYVNGATDGYVTAMGYDPSHPYAPFPTAVGGSSSTYYGDYYYSSTGQRVAILGGRWTRWTDAGLFCWPLDSLSSYASLIVSGRLVKKPL